MCIKCVEAVKKIWPKASRKERSDLLWDATAFPFADPETIVKQLKKAYKKSKGNVKLALIQADKAMIHAMRRKP